MHINLTQSHEMLIGVKNEIDKVEFSNTSTCHIISPRYLPQTVDCGFDDFFCSAQSHRKGW